MTLTYLYDEDCSVSGAPAVYPTTQAATVGVTSIRNQKAGDTFSGGLLVFDAATTCQLFNNTTPRARLAGRMHYCKIKTSATNQDFQVGKVISLVNTTAAAPNPFFAFSGGDPCVEYKNTTDPGDLRLGRYSQGVGATASGTFNDGNFTLKGGITRGHDYEFVLIERGSVGTIHWYRVDGGDWQLLGLEQISSATAFLKFENEGSIGTESMDRLVTANSGWLPTPLVQHSFASVVGTSDGAGQPESGGSGLVGTTSGDLTISSSKLAMNSDGTGIVLWESGQTDVTCWGRGTPVDGGSVVGLILRAVDTSNYLLARVNSATDVVSISKVVAGVETVLASINTNTTPDFFDTPTATELQHVFHAFGNQLRTVFAPGCLHQNYIAVTDSTFNTATKVGVLVAKGTGVASATMKDFVAFRGRQTLLPIDAAFYSNRRRRIIIGSGN
jgi:hypothetical protein